MHMADTKALFAERFDAARVALAKGDEPAAAESLHWAVVAARSDPGLRRELASALFSLGTLSRKLGRAGEREAGPLLTEALAISEELLGREHAALAPVLHELSRLYLTQSQHSRAEDTLGRLLAIARTKGEEHADVAAALSGLAFVKRKLGDDASAEALYRDALRIREKVLEPNDTATIGTMEKLSETCAARGNLAEALALLRRALPAREAVLGAGHERVRAARSRIAELELQIAIADDNAAAEAARSARDATPTPVWLKAVPEPPVDTAIDVASPPRDSSGPEASDVSAQRAPRANRPLRERAKTPAVAAAVAASLIASSIPTPSASQVAISPTESARPSESVAGHESGVAHRDLGFTDIVLASVASRDATPDDWRSAVASAQTDAPRPTRRRRTATYAAAAVAVVAIALAGLLMSRPRFDRDVASVAAEKRVVKTPTDTAAPAAAAPMSTESAAGAASVVTAARTDSLRVASATPANVSPGREVLPPKRESEPSESAPPELRAPNVEVHLDSLAVPSLPASVSVDAILRSAMERSAPERPRASDTNRTSTRDMVAPSRPAEVDRAHTSARIVGRVPDPGFPEELLRSGRREGQVLVRFMVNEVGRVDVSSIIVEQSDDELFTTAVREVLPRLRFEPGRALTSDAKPVAAWVTLPFRFTAKKR